MRLSKYPLVPYFRLARTLTSELPLDPAYGRSTSRRTIAGDLLWKQLPDASNGLHYAYCQRLFNRWRQVQPANAFYICEYFQNLPPRVRPPVPFRHLLHRNRL